MAGSGGAASPTGDVLVLASAVLGSALIVVQGELLEGRDPVAVTAVQMGAAGLFALVFALPTSLPVVAPTAAEAIALGALISVGSLIPFSLYAYGQARVSAEFAGAFVNLEPVVGVASGVLAFGNPFGAWQALGAVLVIAGLALSAGASGRRTRVRAGPQAARLLAPPEARTRRSASAAAPPNVNCRLGRGGFGVSRPRVRRSRDEPSCVDRVCREIAKQIRRSRAATSSLANSVDAELRRLDGTRTLRIDETRDPSLPSRR